MIPSAANDAVSFSKPQVGSEQLLESLVALTLGQIEKTITLAKTVKFTVAHGEEYQYRVPPQEERLLSKTACGKRVKQWASRRGATYLTLKELGFNPVPTVQSGPAGEPIWPDGITGSITHCYPWSIVVAAKCSGEFVIGVDLESLLKSRRVDISAVICRKGELDWISAGNYFHERMAMIFSAKEALYKALYPVLQRYIDFKEVELSWLNERSCFAVEIMSDSAASLLPALRSEVYCRQQGDFVFSCAICQIA
jgi:4'-phosphopantetheinyl transferase EntD